MIIKMNKKIWLVALVVVLIAVGFYMYNQDVVGLDPAECGSGNCKCGSNIGKCSVSSDGNTAVCYNVNGDDCMKTTCTVSTVDDSCECTTEETNDANCGIKKKGSIHSR